MRRSTRVVNIPKPCVQISQTNKKTSGPGRPKKEVTVTVTVYATDSLDIQVEAFTKALEEAKAASNASRKKRGGVSLSEGSSKRIKLAQTNSQSNAPTSERAKKVRKTLFLNLPSTAISVYRYYTKLVPAHRQTVRRLISKSLKYNLRTQHQSSSYYCHLAQSFSKGSGERKRALQVLAKRHQEITHVCAGDLPGQIEYLLHSKRSLRSEICQLMRLHCTESEYASHIGLTRAQASHLFETCHLSESAYVELRRILPKGLLPSMKKVNHSKFCRIQPTDKLEGVNDGAIVRDPIAMLERDFNNFTLFKVRLEGPT